MNYAASIHNEIPSVYNGLGRSLWSFIMLTMNSLFDRYEKECVPKLAPRTQKDYKAILRRLRDAFGECDPLAIKPRDIGRFLDVEDGKVSANRHISVLSAVFSKAVGRWYVHDDLRNPCTGVERNETKPRTSYITHTEFDALYAIVSPSVKIAMELALMTSQRQGDLLKATWRQIDINKRLMYFEQSKTGKKLAIRITPRFEDLLVRSRRLPPMLPRLYLIRRRDGHPYTSEGFKALWQRWMGRALKRGVIKTRFTFHDLRAKCVSDNKSIEAAMHLAGHTNMSMTRKVYDRGVREVDPHE
jgi:integrase